MVGWRLLNDPLQASICVGCRLQEPILFPGLFPGNHFLNPNSVPQSAALARDGARTEPYQIGKAMAKRRPIWKRKTAVKAPKTWHGAAASRIETQPSIRSQRQSGAADRLHENLLATPCARRALPYCGRVASRSAIQT